ncbi:hypothetical protein [Actinokineospora sp.]|uniref:hypothetical protein n=1 Tax=Actinokineospora sp. TaxID=1872133 RepID=UPI003D6AF1D4
MREQAPEAMRETVREYVRAVHTTYLDHVRHLPPAVRAALPLVAAADVTVIAAAARRLHLVATTDSLPAPRGPEVVVVDEYGGTRWTLRFYDPSVLPELGILADDAPDGVRRVLGVGDTVYHLTVAVGGGLTAHHAQHSGVALANLHTKTTREIDRLRAALPRQVGLVDELGTCVRVGLDRAAALLAADLTAGRVSPAPGSTADSCLEAVLREVTGR